MTDAQGNEDTAISLDIDAAFIGESSGGVADFPMYVLEEGSDNILQIGPDGSVQTLVSEGEIEAATGKTDADLGNRGIAVDDTGNVFFTDAVSDAILMKPADGGDIQVLATKSDIKTLTGDSHADPKSLALGSDNKLYFNDDSSDSIVSLDPATGTLAVVVSAATLNALPGIDYVDLDGGIVGSANGKLYTVSDGTPDAVFEVDIATGEASVVAANGPWTDLEGYITLSPNGDLIVADAGTDSVFSVDVDTGEVSTFISHAQLHAANDGDDVDLQGGIAFDGNGNFYLGDEQHDNILKFPSDGTSGGIDADNGGIFVSEGTMSGTTGQDADLEGAITFSGLMETSSETLSIEISDIPTGAVLSAGGTPITVTDGSATLTAAQLESLTITPPEDSDTDFTLNVTATVTKEDGSSESISTELDVTVDAIADAPTVTVADATGNEDSTIALDITSALGDTDGSESLSIEIGGIPTGATLSNTAGDTITITGGTATLTAEQLDGLAVTPIGDSDTDFQLTVTATSTEADGGDTAVTSATLDVTVEAVADVPTVSAESTLTGTAGGQTSIDVPQSVLDAADGTDNTVTISGVPNGASLTAGSDNGDGSWTISPDDLDGIAFNPAGGSTDAASFEFAVVDPDGGTEVSFTSDFGSGADGFSYTDDAFGTDNPYYASGGWGSNDGDSGGGLSLTLGGKDGSDITDGMSAGFSKDFTLDESGDGTITFSYRLDAASSYENDEYSQVVVEIDGQQVGVDGNDYVVQVNGGGDTGWQTVTIDLGNLSTGSHTITLGGYNNKKTSSNEDTEIQFDDISITTTVAATVATGSSDLTPDTVSTYDLDVTGALTDTDGSETLTISVSDLPTGATLSAGTVNPDGSVTLSANDLDGLSISVPQSIGADFDLTVTATATEGENGDTATATSSVTIDVDDTADGATVSTEAASGSEDSAIALDITAGLVDTDGSEVLSVTISDIPTGATLSTGTVNPDGSVTLTAEELDGLTITPAGNSDADFSLSVTATVTVTGSTTTTDDVTDETISGLDAAETLTGGAGDDTIDGGAGDDVIFGDTGGSFDVTATANLDVAAALSDTDGSESLSDVTISGVPSGVTLSAGSDNGDGSWTLTQAELTGLTLGTTAVATSFALTVSATATEADGGDTATATATINVSVEDFSGTSDDVLDGGLGDDQVSGGLGSDTLQFTLGETTTGDDYDGGVGTDTLVVTLTAADLDDADILADLTALQEFIIDNADASTDAGASETFNEIGLTVSDIEAIQFVDENGDTVNLPGMEPPAVSGVTDLSATGTMDLVDHTLETTNDFPVTTESVSLDTSDINGVNMTDLTLVNDHPVTITFESEAAGYQNSLGYYKIDDDGNITDVQFIWQNASADGSGGDLEPGSTTATLDVSSGDQFALFIVPDGFGQNDFDQFTGGGFEFRNADGSGATTDSTDPELVFVADDGTVTTLSGDVYHTAGQGSQISLNSDGEQHAVSGIDTVSGELMIGFEDLDGGGDNDFNDLIVSLDIGAATARNLDATSVASNIDLSDVDSTNLAGATVTIATGYQDGDTLGLPDGTLNGSGVTVTSSAYDAGSGTYTLVLSGAATVEAYEDILSGVQFDTEGNGNTEPGVRSLQIQVTDDTGLTSNVAQMDLDVSFEVVSQTMIGTGDGDTLTGGLGDDRIDGQGGDDVLSGLAGNDLIEGGSGADTLDGGDGDDTLIGGGGADEIYGGAGNDDITGDSANDYIEGGAGDDTIDGLSGADEIHGGEGSDWIEAGSADDIIYGGLDDDSIFGQDGDDLLEGGAGADTLDGGRNEDFLIGGDGDDVLTGGGGKDVQFGGAGNDTIEFKGDDFVHGGSGDDTIQIDLDQMVDRKMDDSIDVDGYDATAAAAANAADGNEIDLSDVNRSGIEGGSGYDTLEINDTGNTSIEVGEDNYEDMVGAINDIEAIDLSGGTGGLELGLDIDDVINLTDEDNELDIVLGEGDSVNFTDDDGSTSFTYFDDGGGIMAKINIRDDSENTGT